MSSKNGNGKAGKVPYQLTAWKPGQSGNPAGTRKAAISWGEVMDAWLADVEAGDRPRRAMETLRSMWEASLAGDTTAARIILDRVWPATQKIDHTMLTPETVNEWTRRLQAVAFPEAPHD